MSDNGEERRWQRVGEREDDGCGEEGKGCTRHPTPSELRLALGLDPTGVSGGGGEQGGAKESKARRWRAGRRGGPGEESEGIGFGWARRGGGGCGGRLGPGVVGRGA